MRSNRTVAILAGGKSQRMGRDKALLKTDLGETWIEKIASVACDFADQVMIMTGPELRYENLKFLGNVELVPDETPGLGPMGGICTALGRAKSPVIYFLTCDMPQISVESLLKLVPNQAEVIYAKETFFPMVVQSTASVLKAAQQCIAMRKFSVKKWLDQLKTEPVQIALPNINTMEDMKSV